MAVGELEHGVGGGAGGAVWTRIALAARKIVRVQVGYVSQNGRFNTVFGLGFVANRRWDGGFRGFGRWEAIFLGGGWVFRGWVVKLRGLGLGGRMRVGWVGWGLGDWGRREEGGLVASPAAFGRVEPLIRKTAYGWGSRRCGKCQMVRRRGTKAGAGIELVVRGSEVYRWRLKII